ncbi:diguanylate cyclase [Anaerolineales bacterium HSG24]|nr:diguanylate cyclase [Anaerolineales bacterium HSG24]
MKNNGNQNVILIIDDNKANIKLLINTLQQHGFETITALNGLMGIRRAKFVKPDLILLDIMMPGMDGFETCRRLKNDDATRDTPIIFLTAITDTVNKVKGLEMDAVDYITKPFHPTEVLARVNKHLTINSLRKQLETKNHQLETKITERKQAEEIIKQQNRFFNTVIESLASPFYVINVEDYTIEIANSAARKLGITDLNTCYALTHNHDAPCDSLKHPCPLTIIRQTKEPTVVEHVHYDKDDNPINIEVHGYPIFDDEGEIIQMIEYSIDVTERKRVERALQESEEMFRSIGSSAQDAIVLMDGHGNISYWNNAAEKIFGYTKAEVMGQHLHHLIAPAKYHEAFERGFDDFKKTGQGAAMGKLLELSAIRKDGSEFSVELSLSAVKLKEQWSAVGIIRDITERKQAEESLHKAYDELEMRVDELGTLNLIMQTLTTVAELDTALQIVAKIMVKLFNASQCGIALLNDDWTELIVTAEYTNGSQENNRPYQNLVGTRIPIVGDPSTTQAVEKGVSVVVPHPQTNPLTASMHDLMRTRNSQCLLIVPLLTRGKTIGTISIHTDKMGREFAMNEVKLAETIAGQIAGAIENARLFEAEKAANQELQRLNEELAWLAHVDGLTQLANRRYFDSYLNQEWQRLRREQGYLSLILLDIDHFKLYNDHYGHLAGDDCLKQVAQCLQQITHRPADLAARYGGEEFALILPHTKGHGAYQLAQQIKTKLSQLQIPHARSIVSPYVTCSMGIASTIPQDSFSVFELIDQTDQALYQAKEQGRNQFVGMVQTEGNQLHKLGLATQYPTEKLAKTN